MATRAASRREAGEQNSNRGHGGHGRGHGRGVGFLCFVKNLETLAMAHVVVITADPNTIAGVYPACRCILFIARDAIFHQPGARIRAVLKILVLRANRTRPGYTQTQDNDEGSHEEAKLVD